MAINFKPDNNYQEGGTATPQVIGDPNYPPQNPYLSQPEPPADVIASGNWKDWIKENWILDPAYQPRAQPAVGNPGFPTYPGYPGFQPPYMPSPQPPQQQPPEEPVEQGEPRELSIEDRNAAIIDIMSGQAAPPELIDWFGRPKTIRPFGGTYSARDIGETPGEIVGQQPLGDVTPVTSEQAADPTTILFLHLQLL